MAQQSHLLCCCLSANFWLIFTNPHESGFRFGNILGQCFKNLFVGLLCVRLVLMLVLLSFPIGAHASIISIITNIVDSKKSVAASTVSTNSQNLQLLQSTRTVDPEQARGGGDITVVGGTALMPESGPIGTMADIEDGMANESISTYVVRKGDTISGIAKMFGVSSNTIIWANDIGGSSIKEGQVLVILPISGVQHTIKKGDTIQKIAKTYGADPYDISRYNNISLNQTLVVGDIVIVPDGEISSPTTKVVSSGNTYRGGSGPSYDGYYLRPILNGRKSQGLHGYNGIDLATYLGAPIFASAEGTIIISAHSGWNGGYGKYVVVAHPNGTQTLYAHASEVLVSAGEKVVKGQIVALVGSTGKSTGSHLHFEIRGAKNPF